MTYSEKRCANKHGYYNVHTLFTDRAILDDDHTCGAARREPPTLISDVWGGLP
jgi:hypothetical protein